MAERLRIEGDVGAAGEAGAGEPDALVVVDAAGIAEVTATAGGVERLALPGAVQANSMWVHELPLVT